MSSINIRKITIPIWIISDARVFGMNSNVMFPIVCNNAVAKTLPPVRLYSHVRIIAIFIVFNRKMTILRSESYSDIYRHMPQSPY